MPFLARGVSNSRNGRDHKCRIALPSLYPVDRCRSSVKEVLQMCGMPRFKSTYAVPNLPTQPYMLAVPPPKATGSLFWSLRALRFGLCSSLRADTPTSEVAVTQKQLESLPQSLPSPAICSSPSLSLFSFLAKGTGFKGVGGGDTSGRGFLPQQCRSWKGSPSGGRLRAGGRRGQRSFGAAATAAFAASLMLAAVLP